MFWCSLLSFYFCFLCVWPWILCRHTANRGHRRRLATLDFCPRNMRWCLWNVGVCCDAAYKGAQEAPDTARLVKCVVLYLVWSGGGGNGGRGGTVRI